MNGRHVFETKSKVAAWALPNQEQAGTDRPKRELAFVVRQSQVGDRISRQKWCDLLHVGTLKRLRVLQFLTLGIV